MSGVNFIPKKVIQIEGVKLSKEISHVENFIQKSYPKKSYPKTYVTYFTLLYSSQDLLYVTLFIQRLT